MPFVIEHLLLFVLNQWRGIKRLIVVIFSLLAWLVTSTAVAQERQVKAEQYRAVNLTKKHGLSIGIYNSIIKDVYGFVWIGGNGLFRFDGTTSEKIIPDKGNAG